MESATAAKRRMKRIGGARWTASIPRNVAHTACAPKQNLRPLLARGAAAGFFEALKAGGPDSLGGPGAPALSAAQAGEPLGGRAEAARGEDCARHRRDRVGIITGAHHAQSSLREGRRRAVH